MQEAERLINRFKRLLLARELSKLTDAQKDLFKRIYPEGPCIEQMEWAIQQCINTIKKGKENKSA